MRIELITLFFLTVTFTFSSCEQEKKEKESNEGYTISGTVIGIDNVYVKMLETGDMENDPTVIDSTLITNGKFQFQGKVDNIDMVSLLIDSKYRERFILENSTIEVVADVSENDERNRNFTLQVTGSENHNLFTKINSEVMNVYNDTKYKVLDEVRELYSVAKKSKKTEDMTKAQARQKELSPLFDERMDAYRKVKFDFIDNNPGSPVAIHVLGFQYSEGRMSKADLKKYYKHFKGEAIKTVFYKTYMTKVYKDNFEKMGVGNTAPDFTLNSVKNESLTLSKIEGKYKLVDFWASWCMPCRASFPHLQKLHAKYKKDGFEILGVGTADIEDKWRKAIEEDKTPWIHLFDISENRAYGSVAKKYGVPHLPTTFLIDGNQKILLRNPTKEELDAKLNELFGY